MKKSTASPTRHKTRRRSVARLKPLLPAGLPVGTQQALMGLAAFEARRA
jgi:hypothetical protein